MSDYADLKARLKLYAGEINDEAAAAIDALERKCADLIAADRDHASATAGMKHRFETRAEAAEARTKRLREAWERVAIGGNHLATWLPEPCPPVETEPLVALEQIGAGIHYDVWCCWRAIMQSRAALQEDKSHE